MKNALKFLVLSLATLSFVSCSSPSVFFKKGPLTKEVKTSDVYSSSDEATDAGTSIGSKSANIAGVCPKCTQRYKANAACCGTISESVLERTTTQGWDGNPFIGLIPTMKPLVSE